MLLSIIIPLYNAEDYLEECLNSCLEQTSNINYEIICVNDGSTDQTGVILQKFTQKSKKIVIIDKTNGGVSSARNMGLERATGEYVWFVDGDDWIRKNSIDIISEMISKFERKPDMVLFGSQMVKRRDLPDLDDDLPKSKVVWQEDGGGGIAV